MPKDYYIILGIPSEASLEEIKNAYRRLAKEYHPDHFGDNCSPFLAVQEAYSVLSDPVRRKAYDREAQNVPTGHKRTNYTPIHRRSPYEAEPLIPEREPVDLGEASLASSFQTFRPSFEELFDRLLGNFSPAPRPKTERLENLTVMITLTSIQALRGGHVRLLVPAQSKCLNCGGRGRVGFYECWRCGGRGGLISEQPVIINYPAGIADNHVVHLSLAQYGIRNLYLTVHFRISDME